MPGPCRGAFERCVGLAECGRSRRGSWLTQKDVCQLQSIMYLSADSQSLKPCAFLVPWAAVSQDDPHSAFFLPHTGDPAEQGRCLHVVMTSSRVRYISVERKQDDCRPGENVAPFRRRPRSPPTRCSRASRFRSFAFQSASVTRS